MQKSHIIYNSSVRIVHEHYYVTKNRYSNTYIFILRSIQYPEPITRYCEPVQPSSSAVLAWSLYTRGQNILPTCEYCAAPTCDQKAVVVLYSSHILSIKKNTRPPPHIIIGCTQNISFEFYFIAYEKKTRLCWPETFASNFQIKRNIRCLNWVKPNFPGC